MYDDVRPTATLFLLTGPWASGKSTLVPLLARLLPDVAVFDWDALLPGLSRACATDAHTDASTWEGLRAMWAAVAVSVLAGGRDVLLCGPAQPDDFAAAVAPHAVRCAFLDCGDDALSARLRARGSTDAEIADELAFMAALRRSGHAPVQAGDRTPEQLAAAVASWVRTTR
ncbi:MAG: hypothetical protein ACJ8GN_30100 [Longimicrobiaceae bacterium]